MNKKIVRANYESCLNAIARLSAFATSTPYVDALEVNQRQDILANEDLIVFCIHARRLIESMELREIAHNTQIKTGESKNESLWRVINYIIHHDELEIIRSATRVRMIKALNESKTKKEYWERISTDLNKKSYSEPISPFILVKSQHTEFLSISLAEIIQVFSEMIILEVIKKADSSGLQLIDDPFQDIELSDEGLEQLSRHRKIP